MKSVIERTLGIIFIIVVAWGLWGALKMLSYKIWYQDMVRKEIEEMVKPECLLDEILFFSDDVFIKIPSGSSIQKEDV